MYPDSVQLVGLCGQNDMWTTTTTTTTTTDTTTDTDTNSTSASNTTTHSDHTASQAARNFVEDLARCGRVSSAAPTAALPCRAPAS